MNTDLSHFNPDILIVGAGMAGLMAANMLQKYDFGVMLVDKGPGVGGRLATRRIGPGRADHGAQFFTARSAEFSRWVEQWRSKGLVFRWSTGWGDGSLAKAKPDGYPRYAVTGGMNALAQSLAQGLNFRLNTRLTALAPTATGWQAESETGQIFSSRAVILTPPAPQSLALLDAGQTKLASLTRTALERIKYAPCLAGLYWVDGPVNLPEPGALQRPEARISWIADNQRKGISPEATLITVHAGPEYSQQLWPAPPAEALAALTGELRPLLADSTQIIEAQLKRWRYALPTALYSDRCLAAADLPPLIFAGDAFGEPRIEGAALSGLAAANKLLDILFK